LEENQAKLSVTTPHGHLGDIAVLLCPFLTSAVNGHLQAPTAVCKFWRSKDSLVTTRNQVLQDIKSYSETELFCKENGHLDL
jgi:hypothetical protein